MRLFHGFREENIISWRQREKTPRIPRMKNQGRLQGGGGIYSSVKHLGFQKKKVMTGREGKIILAYENIYRKKLQLFNRRKL